MNNNIAYKQLSSKQSEEASKEFQKFMNAHFGEKTCPICTQYDPLLQLSTQPMVNQ